MSTYSTPPDEDGDALRVSPPMSDGSIHINTDAGDPVALRSVQVAYADRVHLARAVLAGTDYAVVGTDGICRSQEHYQHGGPARAHVGCTFHGTPAPAFPYVGARAQVTVAEYADGAPCVKCEVGDVGTVHTLPDHQGNLTLRLDRHPDGPAWGVAARNLRPVPVSPGPDQPTEHEDAQVARAAGRAAYEEYAGIVGAGVAGPWSSLADDTKYVWCAVGVAARAVSDHQDAPALRAKVKRLTADAKTSRAYLRLVEDARDAASSSARNLSAKLARVQAERDAARAELDAATTDGLGLRDIRVQRRGDGYVRAPYGINGEDGIGAFASQPTSYLRDLASGAVALLRARLADEAPTDNKETDR